LAILGACALWITSAAPAAAQQRGTIRGTVREASSQRPVEGVQVLIPGTQLSTTTDAQGRFELAAVPVGGAQIRVRAPGYSSALATTMVVGGQTVSVDFALNTSVIALDEVVVTGTGASTERKQLGNTIATVKADIVQDAPVQNFSEAIAAREAGVSILPSNGMAGDGARIRIRGNASLTQSNEPVVYVDGVRVDNGGGQTTGGSGGGRASRLDDINPEIIDRVEILKGAAAATLYGSEASAGVIQIFTKKGTQGRPKFSFRVDQAASRYPAGRIKPNAGFARTQAQADRLQAILGNFATTEDGGPITPFVPFEVPLIAQYYGTGYGGVYSGNVAGGGSDATYNLSARWAREDGPYNAVQKLCSPNLATGTCDPARGAADVDRKVQTSANVTMFPKERVTLSGGLMYADTYHISPPNNNNIYGVQSTLINSKPENANCSESLKLGLGGTYGEDPNNPGHCAGPGNEWGSPTFGTPREGGQQIQDQNAEHFNGNIKATYTPVQELRLESTLGMDVTNTRDETFRPFGYNYDKVTTNLILGSKTFGSLNTRNFTVAATGNWDQKFGILQSTLVFGTQSYITNTHRRVGTGNDFPGPGLEVAGAAANPSVDESFSSIVNMGIIGQEQLGINGWAFVTVGGRWDRNSAFGKSAGGAFYPKVSGSLVVSDMPGWSSSLVSTLRLRGALGRSGLQPGAFDKVTTFGSVVSIDPTGTATAAGLGPVNLGNDSLKPEVTRELELGAEIAFFNNRLAFDVTRWDRKTSDALVAKQYPLTGGFSSPQLSNIGLLAAHGWETKVNAQVLDLPSLSVNVFANAAYLFQRIVSMGGAAPIKVGGSYPRYRNFLKQSEIPGVLLGAKLRDCGGMPCFDTNNDKQADTRAELESYLSVPRTLSTFTTPTGVGPWLVDDNGDGDFYDECLGPSKADPVAADAALGLAADPNHRLCLAKSTPDWSGSFGTNVTLGRHWEVNALFEYKTGNFYYTNLTDAFRNSNPGIGRNVKAAADLETVVENPASTAAQRADALIEYVTKRLALSPYDGLNQTENARFIRFRELAVTYNAPASMAQKLGLSNLAFNLSGRNLALMTPYTGTDPEINEYSRQIGGGRDQNFLDGVDSWGVPLPRRFTFSVRFGF
jgi:TonB-linked SusC/RagA family outer membrane protein